jgi:ABC-type polysaccharide/polyol phosphate transport system ATPase subunit
MPTSSNDNFAIRIRNLSKSYSLKNKQGKDEKLIALDNISLDIQQGEAIGIIGPNGSGKSTLLKILSEITAPDSGSVEIKGKVASILEVGTGFNPDLSGRKNIYLNARLHGMNKAEVDAKFEQIVDLFGFPNFLDTPVKHYSSGMYMRLAFAVVVHIDADIYLFDEVLSVGDEEFRGKTQQKLVTLKTQMKTVFFVTHTPNEFINNFDYIISFRKGLIKHYGEPLSVLIKEQSELINTDIPFKHFHNFKTENNIQILDKTLAKDITPISIQIEFNKDKNKVQFKFEFTNKTNHHNINNVLLIKDIHTRPIAQIELSHRKKQDSIIIDSIELKKNLFGPYFYSFDLICLIDKQPALLLPQSIHINFLEQDYQPGLINLNFLCNE